MRIACFPSVCTACLGFFVQTIKIWGQAAAGNLKLFPWALKVKCSTVVLKLLPFLLCTKGESLVCVWPRDVQQLLTKLKTSALLLLWSNSGTGHILEHTSVRYSVLRVSVPKWSFPVWDERFGLPGFTSAIGTATWEQDTVDVRCLFFFPVGQPKEILQFILPCAP